MRKTLISVTAAMLLAACSIPGHNAVSSAQALPSQQANAQLERNKANVLGFYELAFNQHKLQEAVDKYIGAEYLQHNPSVGDGGQAFINAFTPFVKANPQSRADIKRVIADGDLVVLHVNSRVSPQSRGNAVVDIFRLDGNGKIVEHWDVVQSVPEKTVSGRPMF